LEQTKEKKTNTRINTRVVKVGKKGKGEERSTGKLLAASDVSIARRTSPTSAAF
jgi:hypothetical protein